MPIKNDRILRALRREPVDKRPVWLMRQAGRYLPEYRKVREQVDGFMGLCQNPALACEVTLQPLRRFDLDAAILFSDILTIPDAMGLGLYFVENEGPQFRNPVQTEKAIRNLAVPDPEQDLSYVLETVDLLKQELTVPLLGFSGSPWTLATYMIEGKPSKNFSLIKKMLYQSPEILHQLLSVLANSVAVYLKSQIAHGCDAVMIFDTWGGVLTTESYQIFSLRYMQYIISEIKKDFPETPVTVFTKNGSQWLELIADSGCDCVSIDWTINLALARARIGDRVALQGNLEPAALYGCEASIRQAVKAVCDGYGAGPGHIFNLGHGMQPDFDPEKVAILVDAVHQQSI